MPSTPPNPRRQVLLFSPFFFPEPISTGKYNSTLAAALAADPANEVTVICSHPLYPKWKPERTTEALPNVATMRGGAWLRYPSKAVLRRAVLESWFVLHALSSVLKLRVRGQSPDLAVCIFPPGLFANLLHWVLPKQTRVVGIVHDVQGILATEDTHRQAPAKFTQRLIRAIEGGSYRACDELIFLSEGMRKWSVANYGLNAEKSCVHYPFVSSLPKPTPEEISEIRKLLPAHHKHMVYSGALGEKQAPEKLAYMFVDLCQRHPEWQAHIFSMGPSFSALKTKQDISEIRFHELVPERLLPALLACSDMQVIPQATGTAGGAFPSKLPNIMAANTPVLCISEIESDVGRIVSNYKRGVLAGNWHPSTYRNAFLQIQSMDLTLAEEEKSGNNAFCTNALLEILLRKSFSSS